MDLFLQTVITSNITRLNKQTDSSALSKYLEPYTKSQERIVLSNVYTCLWSG
jgi:hypothetical protein